MNSHRLCVLCSERVILGNTRTSWGTFGMLRNHSGALLRHFGMLRSLTGILRFHFGMLRNHAGVFLYHFGVLRNLAGILLYHFGMLRNHAGALLRHFGIRFELGNAHYLPPQLRSQFLFESSQ